MLQGLLSGSATRFGYPDLDSRLAGQRTNVYMLQEITQKTKADRKKTAKHVKARKQDASNADA
jgi:hypothetical protein